MIVIAERINAARPRIARAIRERNAGLIAREARAQTLAGASFIDVNAGCDPKAEVDNLAWAIQVVQDNTTLPLCLDSANVEALRQGLKLVRGSSVMLNSVTAEPEKIQGLMPLAAESGALLVALTMDEQGLPQTAERRVEIAARLVDAARTYGIAPSRLFIDPCVQPISTSPAQGMAVFEAVQRIRANLPGVHTTCGLSNISFGLPQRNVVNRAYLACLIVAGLDSAIMDPTAEGMMDTVRAAEAIAGRDEFCMNYIRAMRARP